ncbi:MAG: chromosome segregation protein SMC [Oscillospiraceae bacterium]|nr:chromosome segregation protein SMC [Oscillospiraceae bacterium]
MRTLYLKALEIQGFKSFPDKTVLSFGADITAIVGPNGSGKSNISDAVRWVMGEQSTRTLRGSKMEDVIFDGTAKRKGLGFAEVTLVIDNTQHIFPMEESEVSVTRRYYRSGESEYYINRRSCRLRDINELFMDTGLGRDGYSIIGQGRIDEILSAKSGDRREIFEEAAGISRFRHRKEEAERKLAHTDENLVRINDKISELELQVEPLRVQAEKTKKFLVYRDELKGLEISVWLDQLEKLRANSIKLKADFEQASRQRDDARRELDELYAAAERYAEQMREKDLEAERMRLEHAELESRIHSGESEISLLRNDMKNNSENARRIREELEQQKGRAGSIAEQIEDRRSRLAEIESEAAACHTELDRLQRNMDEVLSSAGGLSEELSRLQERERLETASAGEAKELLSALAAAAQELLDREAALSQEIAAQEERSADAAKNAKEMRRELERVTDDRDAAKNVIAGYQMRSQSRRRKAEELQEKHRRLQMDENNLNSRIHMLAEMEKAYEGYSKAIKLVMGESERGGLKGIHGPVAGLLHVPNQYAVAIEIALGGAMQHIVVERDEDGKNAIQWLKRRDGGRATFLPMNTIRPADFRDRGVEREPGFVGMGDALITFDRQYADIFSNLLGRIVIASDMDKAMAMARKFGHRFRIVTLDGQVLNAGGSMTGGSVSRSAGILSRANELEALNEQKSRLAEDLKSVSAELAEAQRELTAAQYELDTAAAQLREAEDAVLMYTERADSANALLADIRLRSETLANDLVQVRRRSEENTAATAQARARIEELEGAAAALRAESEAKVKGQSALQDRVGELNGLIAQVNAKLAGLDGERAASSQNLSELERLRDDLSGDEADRMAKIAGFEQRNRELQSELEQAEVRLQTLMTTGRSHSDALQRINEDKLALEGKRNQADRSAREKNGELLNMEREVSVLEQKSMAAAMEESQILDKLWESYELSHEAAKAQRVELESVPKAQRRIGELKRAISALGNINPDAVEEFQRVNERYTYFAGQRDDVTKAKRELESIITQITGEMTIIFREQFALINETFQETFRDLFRGGKANLELEDPEDILNCGIEIKVQPPGKALKNISLLSGGEKAFVAIAIYFAILKVRPTPFCVMDEIEAALDDANVTRFAQYLRRMSDKTQFIVITHRRGTQEEADVLYGVTMQEQGVSRLLTINLNDVERELGIK